MSHRILLAALLVPALSAVASAQPGVCDDCYAPAPAAPPAPEVDPSRRLGVGLHVAGMSIANHDDPENGEPTELGGGGLQIRYKLTPRWELELGFSALRQHDEDGMPEGPEVQTGTLGALFHMRPGHRWDWYLVGALGGMHVGDRRDRGDDDQGRAMAQLGIGIEHRWHRLGVGIELRAIGIAPAETDAAPAGSPTTAARVSGTQLPPPPPVDAEDDKGDHGAVFSLGATYYF